MNGFELAEKAISQDSSLKILMTSGFTSQATLTGSQEKLKLALLKKPYSLAELKLRISEMFSKNIK